MSVRPRVLVCDADPQSLRALRVVLRGAGFDVDETSTANAALDSSALRAPDGAIIELVLPDGDGVQVCRRLREWSATPVIVLSAIDDEEHKVRALETGADDYLTKPFGARELIARLHAFLRRAHSGDDQPQMALHGLEIDLAAHVVRRDGQQVHLTPIEFKLLRSWSAIADDSSLITRCCSRSGAAHTRRTRKRCAPTSPTCGASSSRPMGRP